MGKDRKKGAISPWLLVTLRLESGPFFLPCREYWLRILPIDLNFFYHCDAPETFLSLKVYAFLLPDHPSAMSLVLPPCWNPTSLALYKHCYNGIKYLWSLVWDLFFLCHKLGNPRFWIFRGSDRSLDHWINTVEPFRVGRLQCLSAWPTFNRLCCSTCFPTTH